MKISIIVAASENNVIGKDNDMPWRLSADLKRFKKLTMGHHIIMGRKTYESIGRPLPGRTSVIITRNSEYCHEGCIIANSIDEALSKIDDDEIFIIGGGEIYNQTFDKADRLYLTRVHKQLDGDTTIPEVDDRWKELRREDHTADEKNQYDYSFIDYERL